ncbi:MAG: cell division protein FtsL [Clostridiales bacterium]|uniref:cell division protein FtsL n=1 Tax=Terrisporobacter sp. TaxID=1965305 RepID=UPI002A53E9B3|nr:cell division protein FtsL [Terrisporobacter sp.]MDD7754258.1 cell division protein FtsL [Clostridiales bacterium]MDY4134807.1 cell division protein FtsL [Terrisporobacter sp.]MDY4737050.1 cell division protein FtsL [Terrisporobacter sp.]
MNKKQRVKNIDEYKKRKKNRYKKRKIKRIIKRILITFTIVAVIIINLCGNAVVTNYKYKLNALEKELRKEEIALDQVKMENLQNSSITNVEQKAKDKLNMNYPNKNQTRYID